MKFLILILTAFLTFNTFANKIVFPQTFSCDTHTCHLPDGFIISPDHAQPQPNTDYIIGDPQNYYMTVGSPTVNGYIPVPYLNKNDPNQSVVIATSSNNAPNPILTEQKNPIWQGAIKPDAVLECGTTAEECAAFN